MTPFELRKPEEHFFSAQAECANIHLQTQKPSKNHRTSQPVTLSSPVHYPHNKGRKLIFTTTTPQHVPMNPHTEGGIIQRAVIANSDRH